MARGNKVGSGHPAHPTIDQAQRAKSVSARSCKWLSSVEADVRVIGNERIVGKPRVELRIFDDQWLRAEDGVRTERDVASHLALWQTDAGLEPLSVGVDQADQHDGHVEHT